MKAMILAAGKGERMRRSNGQTGAKAKCKFGFHQ